MIKLTISGLTAEQRDNVFHTLVAGSSFIKPVSQTPEITPHVDGTFSVTVFGRDDGYKLTAILTDEDSGADYLV